MTVEAIRSGIDLSFVDPAARPQDDLFGHVNGRWLTEYDIPADRATDGAFRTLFDRAEEQVRDLIIQASQSQAAPGTDEQRIGDLYASFLDEDTVERRGLQPLLDELTVIDGAADRSALATVVGTLQRTGVGGGVGLYVDTDSKDSSRYLVHFSQSGIGLPDESYFRDEQHAAVLAAYPGHIATMFGLVFGAARTTTPTPPPGSSRWRANWPPLTGTWSSAVTPSSPTTCAPSPSWRTPRASTGPAGSADWAPPRGSRGTRCPPTGLPHRLRRSVEWRRLRRLEELGALAVDPGPLAVVDE